MMPDYPADTLLHAMTDRAVNNVKSLDKKRGRPRSIDLVRMKALYPDLMSRQSLYNKLRLGPITAAAIKLKLIDDHLRDAITKKRMTTKFSLIAELFTTDFFLVEEGEQWLVVHYKKFVAMKVEEVKLFNRLYKMLGEQISTDEIVDYARIGYAAKMSMKASEHDQTDDDD